MMWNNSSGDETSEGGGTATTTEDGTSGNLKSSGDDSAYTLEGIRVPGPHGKEAN